MSKENQKSPNGTDGAKAVGSSDLLDDPLLKIWEESGMADWSNKMRILEENGMRFDVNGDAFQQDS